MIKGLEQAPYIVLGQLNTPRRNGILIDLIITVSRNIEDKITPHFEDFCECRNMTSSALRGAKR